VPLSNVPASITIVDQDEISRQQPAAPRMEDILGRAVPGFNPTNQGVRQITQTGEVRSRGIELEGVASYDFGLDLIAGYTYLDAEISKSVRPGEQGQRPEQTPQHMASVWAHYTVRGGALHGWGLGAGVRYVGSTWGNIPNTVKVPGYTVADAALHYDWKNARFALNVHNFSDKEYVAAGFFGFASWGAARTVKASLTYRW
jgi:iron complex outermembrane receptor protein